MDGQGYTGYNQGYTGNNYTITEHKLAENLGGNLVTGNNVVTNQTSTRVIENLGGLETKNLGNQFEMSG